MGFLSLREFCKLCNLTARGWLWSSNGLQKWKAEAICDRSCIPLFLWDGMSEKLEHFESANENVWDQKFHRVFHWKFNENGKFWNRKNRYFFRSKIFDFFNWISDEKKSMKNVDFLIPKFSLVDSKCSNFSLSSSQKEKWYPAPIANCLNFPFLHEF